MVRLPPLLTLITITLTACSVAGSDATTGPSCDDGTCDEKTPTVSQECQGRREDAATSHAFRPDGIYWNCDTANSFCEARVFAELSTGIVDASDINTLTDDQTFELEDLQFEVEQPGNERTVARCVISTWLGDASSSPTCADGSNCTIAVDEGYSGKGPSIADLVTRSSANQLTSLQSLVQFCHAKPGDTQQPDAYDEGCTVADSLSHHPQATWLERAAPPAHICAGMSSLWDCGCTDPEDIETKLFDSSFYGPLLSPMVELPVGCSRINDHMVSCEMSPLDVLVGGADACMDKLGTFFEAHIAVDPGMFANCPADATSTCGAWSL